MIFKVFEKYQAGKEIKVYLNLFLVSQVVDFSKWLAGILTEINQAKQKKNKFPSNS